MKLKIFYVAFIILTLSSCSKNNSESSNPVPAALSITSYSVNQGTYDTAIDITGTGFGSSLTSNIVLFNGKTAQITAATSTKLTVVVPKGAGSGPVTVTTNNTTATGPVFTYILTATVSTFAGNSNSTSQDGTGINASFRNPSSITADKNGNIYVADGADNIIRKITSTGVVTTLAGNGTKGYRDGAGSQALFDSPYDIVADQAGNLFVADHGNFVIRKIAPDGTVSTFAGSKTFGNTDGVGIAASFSGIYGLTIDASGNLYTIDNSIRKITPAGVVTTIPNTNGFGLSYGKFCVGMDGNFYIPTREKNTIIKVTPAGVTSAFTGTGKAGTDNGDPSSATFNYPISMTVDKSGNFIVVDIHSGLIRSVTTTGVVGKIAGKLSTTGFTVDGSAEVATFYSPTQAAVDPNGAIFIAEPNNLRIRKIIFE